MESGWYATKLNVDGMIKHKARYVTKSYLQREHADYKVTFSSTAHMTSIRMLMQAAWDCDLNKHQMDVKTAYLNVPNDGELNIEQPEGYGLSNMESRKRVWKIKKSLYGLNHSGMNWNNLLHLHLCTGGIAQFDADPLCIIKHLNRVEW